LIAKYNYLNSFQQHLRFL